MRNSQTFREYMQLEILSFPNYKHWDRISNCRCKSDLALFAWRITCNYAYIPFNLVFLYFAQFHAIREQLRAIPCNETSIRTPNSRLLCAPWSLKRPGWKFWSQSLSSGFLVASFLFLLHSSLNTFFMAGRIIYFNTLRLTLPTYNSPNIGVLSYLMSI